MKTLSTNLLRSCAVTIALMAGFHVASSHSAELDSIVAVAGDDVILNSELNNAIQQLKAQWSGQSGELPPDNVLRRQVLDRLILLKLQLARARSAGLQVSEDDLQQALTMIAERNKMTLNAFADAVTKEGVDYAQLREQVRNEILITKLRQREVESRITVSDQDVALYLQGKDAEANTDNEYRVRHILIAVPEGATSDQLAAMRKKTQDILDRLRKGADFANEAVSNSNDQQALNGGDLGWRSAASLPTIFATLVPRMKQGDISDIISDPNGFHIIKLDGMRHSDSDKVVNETHARHILLKANAVRDEAATKAEAEKLRKQIDGGADFAALAKAHSEDPGSAQQGGDLGWQGAGTFVKPFQDELDAMKPGEIRGPIQTQFGWHILQLIDRRQRDEGTDYVRDKARNAIFQRKVAEEYDQWLRSLHDEAYIEYRIPGAGPVPGTGDSGKTAGG